MDSRQSTRFMPKNIDELRIGFNNNKKKNKWAFVVCDQNAVEEIQAHHSSLLFLGSNGIHCSDNSQRSKTCEETFDQKPGGTGGWRFEIVHQKSFSRHCEGDFLKILNIFSDFLMR